MTCGAIADRTQLIFIEEGAFGVTPPGNQAFHEIRFTSEGLVQETTTAPSTEIREDAQIAAVVRTGVKASGPIAYELSYATYEDWLKAALRSNEDWTTAVTDVSGAITISVTAATSLFTGIANTFDNYTVGSWVRATGFAEAANNGTFKISAKAGDGSTITVECNLLTDEPAGATVSITQGSEIVNGTTDRSYTIERQATDVADSFHDFLGMTIDTFSMSVSLGSIITGDFGFVGQQMEREAATLGDGSPTAATTTEVMSAGNSVLGIYEGGDCGTCATDFTIAIANNYRDKGCVTQLGPACVGGGKFAVTGTLKTYFADNVMVDKYLAYQTTSLAEIVQDGAGNAYVFDIPSVHITQNPTSASGENSDVFNDIAWSAFRDPDEGITMRIVRFPAA